MRVVRGAAVLTALALLALPAAASAQGSLPIRENDGVRIVRPHGALVVVFTSKAQRLWRKVAGRRVSVYCTKFLESGTMEGGATSRVPKRGRRIRTGDRTPRQDFCRIWLERRKRSRELITSVPLTREGAVFVDEEEKVGRFMSILVYASLEADNRDRERLPTADELLAWAPRLRAVMAPLTGPEDTPPAGKVGYWSDGEDSVAGVAVSTLGRRLFYHLDGDVLHTNVAGYVYNDIDLP